MVNKHGNMKLVAFVAAVLILAALACGPTAQVNEAVQQAQDIAEQAEGISTTVAGEVEEAVDAAAEDGEIESPQDLIEEMIGEQIEACPLLSDDEIAAGIGSPVTSTENLGLICLWEGESGRRASLTVQRYDQGDLAVTFFDTLVSVNDDEGSELLDGPWDGGFWAATTSGQFYVRERNIILTINCGDWSVYPDSKDCSIGWAETIVSRLP